MSKFLAVAIAVFLDRLFGELPTYHPLRGFSRLAIYLEDQWHRQESASKHTPVAQIADTDKPDEKANKEAQKRLKIKGGLATFFLVIPFVALSAIISQSLPTPMNFVFDTFILYLAIGAHSLKQHASDVQNALISENLEMARKNLALIDNRDTKYMDRQDIVSTCIESIIENSSETILAPIFWFLIFGAPAVVLSSLLHILNNLWGHQDNVHYKYFGWAAGRANNTVNWIPSRLAAFSYIVLGDMKNGWQCLKTQAKNWNSPNAELLIASGAGALNIEVGGDFYNQEQVIKRAKLGQGKIPDLSDIARTCDLVDRSMILWLALTLVSSIGH